MKKQIGCVVLMGGKSSRMGTDKAFLQYQGITFWQRIANEMSRCAPTYLSVNCLNNVPKTGHKVFLDEFEEIGPIGGIYSSLSKAKEELLFFAPCDLPTITEELILAVMNQYEETYDGVILTSAEGKCFPTVGVYSKRILPKLKEQIQNQNYKLMHVIHGNYFKIVNLKELRIPNVQLININTPEEYHDLTRSHRQDSSI